MPDQIFHSGSCLCGKVRYHITGAIHAVTHCHCSLCRKIHGAAFATYASVLAGHHHFSTGAGLISEYASSKNVIRRFCSVCGSPLLWKSEGAFAAWVSFPLATLETEFFPLSQRHVHVSSRATWNAIHDIWPQHD